MTNIKRKSILIVDDEGEIRDILKRCALSVDPNIYIAEAGNGIEAEAKARSQQFDCIVSDISMPKSDGIDFLYKLAQLGPESRPKSILILSGYFNPARLQSLPMPVPVEYFPKPCSITYIKNYFRKVLGAEGSAPAPAGSTPHQAIGLYIDNFISSITEFSTLKIKKEGLYTHKDNQVRWEISFLTTVHGCEDFESVVLSCSKTFLKGLTDQIKAKDPLKARADGFDVANDFINMVHDKVKASLAVNQHKAHFNSPFTVFGAEYVIKCGAGRSYLISKLSSDLGPLQIEFHGV
jgi:CheY-like chemotaxis protein